MRAFISLAALLALACGGQEPSSTPSGSGRADTNQSEVARWTASAQGAGAVRIGMTTGDAETILGVPFAPSADAGTCVYRRTPAAPDGVLFMEVGGRIARIDISAAGIPTDRGIEVGGTEARVREAYGSGLATSPHKYTSGHYLTFAADPAHRMVFETDGERVTRYRVGRLPEVEWVEGCS